MNYALSPLVHMLQLHHYVTPLKSWVFGEVSKVRGTLDEGRPPDGISVLRREASRELVGSLPLWRTQ